MKIIWFCIPAYGHTNPTIEVVRELVRRGHTVRYYSFEEFREKIEGTGAEFVSCDAYLSSLDARTEKRLRKVSTTEMSVQSFETTGRMDGPVSAEIEAFKPDLLVSDSACFWGKLLAAKHRLPLVVSTTTFAFNQYSSKYMKYSFAEMADMIFGLPRMNRALKALQPLGYEIKSALDIVQNKNDTDTIVFTSEDFQPCSETFDKSHYVFSGPSLRSVSIASKEGKPPLIYISLGTVINDHPDFYLNCIRALRDEPVEVLISCGKAFDPASLGPLPPNVHVEQYVDQLDVLSRSSVFITHCGMNSASEGLYMGVPELLFPLTGEQRAVARRIHEVNAGLLLSPAESKQPDEIAKAVRTLLSDHSYTKAALRMRSSFIAAGGASKAAGFILSRG